MNKDQLAARLIATFAAELAEQVQTMNADLLALEANPRDAERVKTLFRVAHTLKGAARAAGVTPIEQACHALEELLVEARDGRLVLGQQEFALFFAAADTLGEAAKRLADGRALDDAALAGLRERVRVRGRKTPPAAVEPAARPAAEPAPRAAPVAGVRGEGQVRVEAEKLEALLAASGQLFVAESRIATRPLELEALHDVAARSAVEWHRAGRRLRLELERLGAPAALLQKVNGMEERLRHLQQEAGRLATSVAEDARVLALVTDDVADRVRRLRLRPFGEACEALPRVVRDLAATGGKEADLDVHGGEVQVDRSVLDALREALLQLVRNAVDHGIEPAALRERAGKPRRGRITVTAALAGDRVAVTVSDDGAGLDVPAVRAQLEQHGLPVPEEDRAVARALFEGGFSTRGEATAISGRGVGLDVVRATVQRIHGTVDVSWQPGRGTTFVMECPPTLATVRCVLAGVGPQLVAIPTAHVVRLLRVRSEDIRRAEGRDVITTALGAVPLVSLARLLPPLVDRPATGALAVVLLSAGDRRLAVAVDELVAEQEVVLRPVGRGGEGLPHVSGAAILGTGRVVLVLNPASLVMTGLNAAGGETMTFADAAPGRGRTRILVVDDSITTRTLEQSILEAAGYDVVSAVDGVDAWRVLQERDCQLVVSDVEMPRMDGFALCETIRSSTRFRTLPVVLVTALETAPHRARGLEVGADAYVGKSSFDQQHLLDTIRQLVG